MEQQLQKQNIPSLLESDENLILFVQQLATGLADYKQFTPQIPQIEIAYFAKALREYVEHHTRYTPKILRALAECIYLLSKMILYKLSFFLPSAVELPLEEDEVAPSAIAEPLIAQSELAQAADFFIKTDRGVTLHRSVKIDILPDTQVLSPLLLQTALRKLDRHTQGEIPLVYSVTTEKAQLVDRCIKELTAYLNTHQVSSFHSLVRRIRPNITKQEYCAQFFAVLSLCYDKKVSIDQKDQWKDFTLVYIA